MGFGNGGNRKGGGEQKQEQGRGERADCQWPSKHRCEVTQASVVPSRLPITTPAGARRASLRHSGVSWEIWRFGGWDEDQS
jgi:hypothetical protein